MTKEHGMKNEITKFLDMFTDSKFDWHGHIVLKKRFECG